MYRLSAVIAKERSDCGTEGNACGAIRSPWCNLNRQIAPPHPSRLTPCHLLPLGEGFPPPHQPTQKRTANGRPYGVGRTKGNGLPRQCAHWLAMTVGNLQLPQKRYRADQGSYDYCRTSARVVSGHWPPARSTEFAEPLCYNHKNHIPYLQRRTPWDFLTGSSAPVLSGN